MADTLTAQALMSHIHALAHEIGPRPAGHAAEARARAYIWQQLLDAGFARAEIQESPFLAHDTWGYTLLVPIGLMAAGNALAGRGRAGKLVGAAATLFSAYHLWRSARGSRQPLAFIYPQNPTGNVIARICPTGEKRHTVVLVGHTDSNKARETFGPSFKPIMPISMALGTILPMVNGVAQLVESIAGGWIEKAASAARWTSLLAQLSFVPLLLRDEQGGYVHGASDNASAVACLLGLGAHLKANPLRHTEVWLAFTGAEEVGDLGMHHLLDEHGEDLRGAWFIDFEMVATPDIAYVTQHGISPLARYAPDLESLDLARETSRRHPELGVSGREMVMVEEVGSLRGRGYRGICLVGVGPDGWLENWHQSSDRIENVKPEGVERAARFGLAMLQTLDERGGN